MEPLIINLVGLSDAEAALFAEAGITDWTTIALLDLPAYQGGPGHFRMGAFYR
jgi:hypothetical protein